MINDNLIFTLTYKDIEEEYHVLINPEVRCS